MRLASGARREAARSISETDMQFGDRQPSSTMLRSLESSFHVDSVWLAENARVVLVLPKELGLAQVRFFILFSLCYEEMFVYNVLPLRAN